MIHILKIKVDVKISDHLSPNLEFKDNREESGRRALGGSDVVSWLGKFSG